MRLRDASSDRMRAALNLDEPYDLPLTATELRTRMLAREAKKNGGTITPLPAKTPDPGRYRDG